MFLYLFLMFRFRHPVSILSYLSSRVLRLGRSQHFLESSFSMIVLREGVGRIVFCTGELPGQQKKTELHVKHAEREREGDGFVHGKSGLGHVGSCWALDGMYYLP
jgi:hypothetical protein